jgi:hypothetical protein
VAYPFKMGHLLQTTDSNKPISCWRKLSYCHSVDSGKGFLLPLNELVVDSISAISQQ